MSEEIWLISENEEVWSCHEEFDNKEDAIQYGLEEFAGDPFYVGRKGDIPKPEEYWNADDWLEYASGQEEFDLEVADGWDNSTAAHHAELEALVRPILAKWLDRHNLRPRFCLIEAVEFIDEGASI